MYSNLASYFFINRTFCSMEAIQDRFALLGLDSPVKRGVVGASIGYLITEAARPSISYNEDGSKRPWAVMDPEAKNATMFPWFLWPAVSGASLAVFL